MNAETLTVKWKVQLKGDIDDPKSRYELSVIRTDNACGQDSWGWYGLTKLPIATSDSPCQLNPRTPEQIAEARRIAQVICDALNQVEE